MARQFESLQDLVAGGGANGGGRKEPQTAAARLEKLAEQMTCSICCDTFENPHSLPCQHSFCEECIWEYINELNKFAQTYSVYQGVPQNMMGKIQSMAEGIAEKVEKNEMSLSDLNFASLSQTAR